MTSVDGADGATGQGILRTPDERFADLPGFPFEPHYVEVVGLRMHYIDEGRGPVVLLLHGEPTWAYLYRKMIPVLVEAGLRAIAPDHIGFGRSDKLAARTEYTYKRYVDWMHGFVGELGLEEITLFGQDWGGLIGLRCVAENPDRYARVVASNTGLPEGAGLSDAFLRWREFSQQAPEFPVGSIVSGGCATAKLTPEEVAAYDAPFPDESYKEACRQFPVLVPVEPDDPAIADQKRAWAALERFTRPFLTAFGSDDPVTGGGDRIFQERVPGARGRPHTRLEGGGHFIQEDRGEDLARIVADFVAST